MIENRKTQYLDAMGIGVWALRSPSRLVGSEPESMVLTVGIDDPVLKLGPGSGGVLLVCEADVDSSTSLADDIGRSLGGVPVWAWPDTDDNGLKLELAVEEKLFTAVAIFGSSLAKRFFAGDPPQFVHSAAVVLLPAMGVLKNEAAARCQLWDTLCRSGMVTDH